MQQDHRFRPVFSGYDNRVDFYSEVSSTCTDFRRDTTCKMLTNLRSNTLLLLLSQHLCHAVDVLVKEYLRHSLIDMYVPPWMYC